MAKKKAEAMSKSVKKIKGKTKSGAKRKLDAKERLFVAEYLIDLNPRRSAIDAGYSETVAKTKAYQWVSKSEFKPHVYEAIQKRLEKKISKLDITSDKVLQEIARLGFSNMADFVDFNADGTARIDFSKVTREQASAIQEISVDEYLDRSEDINGERVRKTKFKLADKRGSLKMLGDYLKLFTTTLEVKDFRISIVKPKDGDINLDEI